MASSAKPTKVKAVKKEPEYYVFRLVKEHPKYYESASIFPPKFVIPNKDTILYEEEKEGVKSMVVKRIRYIDGLDSIFVDDQEKNGELPEYMINRPGNEIVFENGFLRVPAYNRALLQFLKLGNQCEQQTNKFKQVESVYRLLDFGNTDEKQIALGKSKDKAYDLARTMPDEDMIPHAKFLGIPFIHTTTGEDRDMEAIREDYKSKALDNPEAFLKFANNPKVKIRFNVERAFEEGIITTGLVKNQLHWSLSKQYITDLPTNIPSVDAVVDFVFKTEGEAFYKTLQSQL